MSGAGYESNVEFNKNLDKLDKVTLATVKISEKSLGVVHTGRQNRALFLLAKLIAHNMSILSIIDRYNRSPAGDALLDHFSIASLGRTVIDASLMTMYISHPSLTRTEWNLRRYVLYLHDITNRKRFISALPASEDLSLKNYPRAKDELIRKIKLFASQLGLTSEEIEDLTNGQKVYISGARGAVREAGWDVNQFRLQSIVFVGFRPLPPGKFYASRGA